MSEEDVELRHGGEDTMLDVLPRRVVGTDIMNDFQKSFEAAPQDVAFTALSQELERRSRQWISSVRLLEQQRQILSAAEAEREAAYAKFAEVVPLVEATASALRSAIDNCKEGGPSDDLERLFEENDDALHQMETVSIRLSEQFLSCRSAWEQYAQTVEAAKKLRIEMAAG